MTFPSDRPRRRSRIFPAFAVIPLLFAALPATAGPVAFKTPAPEIRLAEVPYRYRASPNRNYVVRPAPPYYHYRPRVRVPGVPETRLEYQPSYRGRDYAPVDRGSRDVRRRGLRGRSRDCLHSRPTHRGSSTRVYGLSRNC